MYGWAGIEAREFSHRGQSAVSLRASASTGLRAEEQLRAKAEEVNALSRGALYYSPKYLVCSLRRFPQLWLVKP
ncbi:predicted protein [Coccidioides posadasii str. Silveira]|uniref:Predicted protein n=1 Tax=Coccidioides posadasii (strain RMSCC 757 / Silveira) TaxID=443226 RepID=E9CTF6_COCPS|nr:predicted protein [Coccidioides posadasii str. Silveira]